MKLKIRNHLSEPGPAVEPGGRPAGACHLYCKLSVAQLLASAPTLLQRSGNYSKLRQLHSFIVNPSPAAQHSRACLDTPAQHSRACLDTLAEHSRAGLDTPALQLPCLDTPAQQLAGIVLIARLCEIRPGGSGGSSQPTCTVAGSNLHYAVMSPSLALLLLVLLHWRIQLTLHRLITQA